MTRPEPPRAPTLPIGPDDEPAFSAPWQAQAFAMTVRLHEAGLFTWPEWAETLGREIAKAGDGTTDGMDPTDAYYRHWLDALETLLTEKQVIGEAERQDRIAAWDRAARATPHGAPIELGAETRLESKS